jgi:predicted PilT family ATPase
MAKKKRPRDTNRLAKSVVDQATSVEPEEEESPKATAGRKGGLKGGKARAEKLTAEERSKIARKAAAARWKRQ